MPNPVLPAEPEIDHVAAAVARLPVAFRTPLILAIVRAFAARTQVIWDMQRVILRALDLSDPFCEDHPWALERWGALLGVPRRKVWTTAVWRIVLLAAVAAQRSCGTRDDVLAVVRALTPAGAAQPTVTASPLTVWVHAPGIVDPIVQEALRELLYAAIPDVADLVLDFSGEDALKFDAEDLGFDKGKFS